MFGFAYFLSGAAGLLYQVAWLRHLTLAFGHTHAAVSTVLAGFLGGLAAGAWLADRAASLSPVRAIRLYCTIELGIAAYAMALPALVVAASALAGSLYGDVGGTPFALARSASALLLVALPAAAMGATFPLAVRAGGALGGRLLGASTLYTLNTAGATAGAALTGFVLLPALGFWRTTLVGAAINIGAAVAAATLIRTVGRDRAVPAAAPPDQDPRPRRPDRQPRTPTHAPAATGPTTMARWPVHGAAMLSGFAVLVLEVAWTRILTLVLGPTTWAFALMLTLFIGGLALGAGLGTWLARHTKLPALWMGMSLAAGAIATVLTPGAVGPLILDVAGAAARPDASVAALLRAQSLAVALVLLPKTLTLGAAFPLALAVIIQGARARGSAARVGRLYAINTIGAIAGSLAAGFALLPRLGLHDTIVAVSMTLLTGAGCLFFASWPRARALAATVAIAAIVAALTWTGPRLDARLLTSGAYKYAAYLGETDVRTGLTAGQLLYYRDGGTATVSVRRLAGVTSLAIDGKVDASDGGDMLTQKLLGHVPLLLRPAARDVAVIGLGSGVTPGAVLQHPVSRLDVLEISPEVVAASAFFTPVNNDPLADQRTRLVVGDARAHILFTRRRYDVVISEPSNPWMAGMAALFTKEFFQAVRDRLVPGGVMCQWTHTYDMGREELGSIVGTFQSVFPHVLIWRVGEGDVLLIGADHPLDGALAAAGAWAPPVAADLAIVGVERPFSLLSLAIGGSRLAETLGRFGAIQTDDRLTLEFSAPRFILGRLGTQLADFIQETSETDAPPTLRALRESATSADWRARAVTMQKALAHRLAMEAASQALRGDPSDVAAVHLLLDAAAAARQVDDAQALLLQLRTTTPAAAAPRIGLSRLAAARGDYRAAVDEAQAAIGHAPDLPEAVEQLASVAADAGDESRLGAVVADLQRRFPGRAATSYFDASRLFLAGDFAGALDAGQRAVDAGDPGSRAWNLIGAAHASLGDGDKARHAFEQAVRVDRQDLTSLVNLARLEASLGDLARAEDLYAEVLAIDPRSRDALDALASLAARRGDADRAAHLRALAPGG